ncbi:hypothetical protein GM921_00810 [Pedobacter sp. LMG 31464]|uniref:MORN repeat variant n=1 Tax=Pedobacter planticolens TaxID=2679964 RepID=A0A923DVV6_9SPHI|nr:hypothetical protein [Pedobacter planticolens]MBB2144011.1 hypothetical protein [Pedobacter planticolens]
MKPNTSVSNNMRTYQQFLLFVLCCSFTIIANAQDKIYASALATYHHTITYTNYKESFLTAKEQQSKLIDNKAHYYWYSNNQLHATQGGFSGKLLDGPYTAIYLNGNLKEQGLFKNGLKQGIWKVWNEDGILLSQKTYQNGLPEGKYQLFAKGELQESGNYSAGKINGKVVRYIRPDSIQHILYRNGEVVQQAEYLSWIERSFKPRHRAQQ